MSRTTPGPQLTKPDEAGAGEDGPLQWPLEVQTRAASLEARLATRTKEAPYLAFLSSWLLGTYPGT